MAKWTPEEDQIIRDARADRIGDRLIQNLRKSGAIFYSSGRWMVAKQDNPA